VKFLAAEALRGAGGILLDRHGNRFADELGKRDYVSGKMWLNEGPYRLVLNDKASQLIEWHCKHYTSRGFMKLFDSGKDLAAEIGCDVATLDKTFGTYNTVSETPSFMHLQTSSFIHPCSLRNTPSLCSAQAAETSTPEKSTDEFGKTVFQSLPYDSKGFFYVAQVTPAVHYTMGGLEINASGECLNAGGDVIPGLYAAGEVMGGVHGKNRLGGNSLLDCVVYGRVTGAAAAGYTLQSLQDGLANGSLGGAVGGGGGGGSDGINIVIDQPSTGTININSDTKRVTLDLQWSDGSHAATISAPAASAGGAAAAAAPVVEEAAPVATDGVFSLEEIAAHNTEGDCWCIVDGFVYDLTEFLPDHPGGKRAPLIYAGKDATEEFMMLHKPEIITKYGKPYLIGTVAPSAKL
jgi:cytochrome b involved in lipid metabolism